MISPPAFIITIDTEPDDQWNSLLYDQTANARYIPRFQSLCEKYNFKPVYLTEYNMAKDPFFIEYFQTKLAENKCEIGVHPHAWSTPPFVNLTDNDCKYKPFLIDFTLDTMRDKFSSLMEILTRNFGNNIISHRAGRWAFNTDYLGVLIENGIKIDCSVLPHHKIAKSSDEAPGNGTSFVSCPDALYEMDVNDFAKQGKSGVFEVPMTVYDKSPFLRKSTALISSRLSNRKFGMTKLRPESGNIGNLLDIVQYAEKKDLDYLEFMLHSSEFMPGCSLAFPDSRSIELLFTDLEKLFERISGRFIGKTLKEFVFPENENV